MNILNKIKTWALIVFRFLIEIVDVPVFALWIIWASMLLLMTFVMSDWDLLTWVSFCVLSLSALLPRGAELIEWCTCLSELSLVYNFLLFVIAPCWFLWFYLFLHCEYVVKLIIKLIRLNSLIRDGETVNVVCSGTLLLFLAINSKFKINIDELGEYNNLLIWS